MFAYQGNVFAFEQTIQIFRSFIQSFKDKNNFILFASAYVVCILSYSYLFFGTVYNNHDFPNSFYRNYPSFVTLQEGRFIGDIIYFLQGGSGIPTLHMAIAVAIQLINGFLAASLLEIRGNFAKFCLICIFAIHPAITDYYSWGGCGIIFCLGDTFAIASVLFLFKRGLSNMFVSALFIVCAVATYQPKVSLFAALLILACMSKVLNIANIDLLSNITNKNSKIFFRSFFRIAGVGLVSIVIYYLFFKLTVPEIQQTSGSHRLHINNTLPDLLKAIGNIFSYTNKYFFSNVNFLHPNELFLTAIITAFFFVFGIFQMLKTRGQSKILIITLFTTLFLLLPFAMNLVFIITKKAYATDGRFFGAYALVLGYFLSFLVDKKIKIFYLISVFLILFFIFDNAQYSYRAYLQNRFEFSFATRIVARLEEIIDPSKSYKLVSLGNLPWSDIQTALSRKGNMRTREVVANYDQPGFIHYRRAEYLNFLLGRQAFTASSSADQANVKKLIGERKIYLSRWPHTNSIIITPDNCIVLSL